MARPDVVEAAVFALPDETWGERPRVAVVLREGAVIQVSELRARLATGWARWELPERWTVVAEVPRDERGQVRQEGAASEDAEGALAIIEAR